MALMVISWPLGLCEATLPITEDVVETPCRNYGSGGEHGDNRGGGYPHMKP